MINSKGAVVFETSNIETIETSNFAVGLCVLRISNQNGARVFKIGNNKIISVFNSALNAEMCWAFFWFNKIVSFKNLLIIVAKPTFR